MNRGERTRKVAVVMWAIGIGVVLLFLGTAVMLPSTKRASPEMMKRLLEEQRQRDAEAGNGAQTRPAEPRLQPADPALLPSTKSGLIRVPLPAENPADLPATGPAVPEGGDQ